MLDESRARDKKKGPLNEGRKEGTKRRKKYGSLSLQHQTKTEQHSHTSAPLQRSRIRRRERTKEGRKEIRKEQRRNGKHERSSFLCPFFFFSFFDSPVVFSCPSLDPLPFPPHPTTKRHTPHYEPAQLPVGPLL